MDVGLLVSDEERKCDCLELLREEQLLQLRLHRTRDVNAVLFREHEDASVRHLHHTVVWPTDIHPVSGQ